MFHVALSIAIQTVALHGVYDVKADYGATGDGVADDTAEIQAAITAAIASDSAVIIPRGIYLITSPLTVPIGSWAATQAIRISGVPGAVIRANASIARMMDWSVASWVTFEDVELDCNSLATTGLYMDRIIGKSSVIRNVSVHDCLGDGVSAASSQVMNWYDLRSYSNGGDGFDVTDSNGLVVVGGLAERNVGDGYQWGTVTVSSWMSFRDVVSRLNAGHGFHATASSYGGTITGSAIHDNTDDEIEINSKGVLVADSLIRHRGSANAILFANSGTGNGGNRAIDNTIFGTVSPVSGETYDYVSNPARASGIRAPILRAIRASQPTYIDGWDYGLGDAQVDVAPLMATAIAAALAADRPLYLPRGAYPHLSTIEIDVAAGRTLTIVGDWPQFALDASAGAAWSITGAGNVSITRVHIDGNGYAPTALSVADTTGAVALSQVSAGDVTGDCWSIANTGRVDITYSGAGTCGGDGIDIHHTRPPTGAVTIDGWISSTCTGCGIRTGGAGALRGTTIFGADVETNSGCGVWLGERRNVLAHSWFEGNVGDPVTAASTDQVVKYNRILGGGGASDRCVRLLHGGARTTIRGNTCEGGVSVATRSIRDEARRSPIATYGIANTYGFAASYRMMAASPTYGGNCAANTACWESIP